MKKERDSRMPQFALTRSVFCVMLEQEVILERLQTIETKRVLATFAHDLCASVGSFEERATFRTLFDVLEVKQQTRRHARRRSRCASCCCCCYLVLNYFGGHFHRQPFVSIRAAFTLGD